MTLPDGFHDISDYIASLPPDKAQDAIFVQGESGTITYWNKSAERLYGWTADEMAQTPNSLDLFTEDAAKIAQAREAVIAKGEWTG